MKVPRLYIENIGTAQKLVAGHTTKVFLLIDDENGVEQKVDISILCRAVDVRLHVGEAVTAKLEMFVTGLESRAKLEDLVLRELKPRRRWLRGWRDVTTFPSRARELA